MNRLINHLSDLLVFIRVVDLKSFSETARVTGLTKSAVSKQIKRLEKALGTRLLNRTTRHPGLTDTGNAVICTVSESPKWPPHCVALWTVCRTSQAEHYA